MGYIGNSITSTEGYVFSEATLASATTTDLGTVASEGVDITGTTTITSFGTSANLTRFLRFTGALTLTYNSTSLILPGAASITTAAGDIAIFHSDSSGNWRCLVYQPAAQVARVASFNTRTGAVSPAAGDYTQAQVTPKYAETVFASSGTFTTASDSTTSTVYRYRMVGAGGGAGNNYGGGGGGGGYAEGTFTGVAASTGITITVGAGGAGGASGGANTNGQSTRMWLDFNSTPHTFSIAQFKAFATAVGAYVDSVYDILVGGSIPNSTINVTG